MKQGKLMIIGISLCLIIGVSLFFLNQKAQSNSQTIIEEVDVKQEIYNIESKVLLTILKKMEKKNYTCSIDYDIISNNKIKININLPNNELDHNTKTEIYNIAKESIESTDYNSKLFKIEITNYNENNQKAQSNPQSITKEEDFEKLDNLSDSLAKDIPEALEDKGIFETQIGLVAFSLDKITVDILIKEEPTEKLKEKIEQVLISVAKKNELDPNALLLTKLDSYNNKAGKENSNEVKKDDVVKEGYILNVESERFLFIENISEEKYNKIKKLSLKEILKLKENDKELHLYWFTYNTNGLKAEEKVKVWIDSETIILQSAPAQTSAKKVEIIE